MIRIKFYSILKRYNSNQNVGFLELKNNRTVRDILNEYNIIPGEVGVILLNSKLASEDSKVKDNDIIEIFPVFGGG